MVVSVFFSIFTTTYDWISDSKEDATIHSSWHLSQTIIVTSLILIIGKYLQYRWENRRFFKLASQFDGPKPLPLIGNALMFAGNSEDVFNSISYILKTYNKGPSRFWLGNELFIVISKPNDMRAVLTNPNTLQKPHLYSFITSWLGNGLFSAPVSMWKPNRKIIMPAFNQKILDTFISVFQERSDVLVKKLETETDYFDVFPYVSRCTLDIICESALGIKIMSQEDGNCKYVENSMKILDIVYKRMTKLWYHPNFLFKLSKYAREEKRCINYLHNFTDTIIKKKRIEFNEMKKSNEFVPINIDNDEPILKRKPFLQLLMETSDFTDEQIRNEVDTITVAGNDTTATANSFTLLLLAIHSEIQEKLYAEVYEIFGDSDKVIDLEDLQKLKYTEMVIKESMRLFPVGPLLARVAVNDIPLDNNYIIPKGSAIALGIFQAHRDPKYWPEPNVFNPERFQPEEIAKRHAYCFLPFSGGQRNCIGIKYAYMAMKILIATVIRNYKLSTDLKMEDLKLKVELTLKLSTDFRIKLQKRQSLAH